MGERLSEEDKIARNIFLFAGGVIALIVVVWLSAYLATISLVLGAYWSLIYLNQ